MCPWTKLKWAIPSKIIEDQSDIFVNNCPIHYKAGILVGCFFTKVLVDSYVKNYIFGENGT